MKVPLAVCIRCADHLLHLLPYEAACTLRTPMFAQSSIKGR